MNRTLTVVVLTAAAFILVGRAGAQDSQSAAATRKKLQQQITISEKEVGIKNFLEGINNEVEKQIRFKIDNVSGVSNNMKVSFSGKNVTVEKILNELSDKYEFGYYVISNAANNKEDGMIVVRKSGKGKERGYEAGKEPKKADGAKDKQSSLTAPRHRDVADAAVRWTALDSCLAHSAWQCYRPEWGIAALAR